MNYYNLSNCADFLVSLIAAGNLIPIFGAGFSAGEKSKKYHVPLGDECRVLFNKLRNVADAENSVGDLMQTSEELFSDLNHNRVPLDGWLALLRNYFTDVHLSNLKADFLNLRWPFAFTLNIDDGIERSSDFRKLLPYQNCRQPHDDDRILYKLHGDADWEYNYKNENNLVFNFNQYIDSILAPSNQTMHDILKSTFKSRNMLYIGCSLKNEPDLQYIYRQVKSDVANKKNIFVCSSKPDGRVEERLADNYGITDIIIVSNSNYDQFYTNIIDKMHSESVQKQLDSYDYANPKFEIKNDLKYFTGLNVFDRGSNVFYKSKYFIERDSVFKIENDMEALPIVVVGGRRFTGKTVLLSLLAEREKTREVYFFPSDTQVDSDVIKRICEEKKNILLLFDSNSISDSAYKLIGGLADILVANNNRIVAALGMYDNLAFDNEGIAYEPLFGKFSESECKKLNSLTNTIPLTPRNSKNSNLDYLALINDQQKIPLALDELNKKLSFTEDEQILMLILSVKEKVYEKDFSIALNIGDNKVKQFLAKLPKIVELIPTTSKESRNASSCKLVHNSRMLLDRYIQAFSESEIIRDIKKIVMTFKHGSYDQKLIYREVMKYDSLSQMFGKGVAQASAPSIIQHVYSELQELLNDDMHYWLQRAKCIYRIKYKDLAALKESYKYAKYVYNGTDKERLKKLSALSVSLICAYMADLVSDADELRKLYVESIELGHEAMFSIYFKDENYRRAILSERNYNSLMLGICEKLISIGIYDSVLFEKAKQIAEKVAFTKEFTKEERQEIRNKWML